MIRYSPVFAALMFAGAVQAEEVALIDAIKGYMGKPKQNNPKKWTFRALKSLVDDD